LLSFHDLNEHPTMKFLAILRDSFREAVDSKVIYVTLGLSVLLTLVAATMTFKPRPANEMMKIAAFFLSVNATDFDPDRIMKEMATSTDLFEVVSAEPRDGAPDAPTSSFTVILKQTHKKPRDDEARDKGEGEEKRAPDKNAKDALLSVEDRIRTKFGVLDELHIVDVQNVRVLSPTDPGLPEKSDPEDKFYEVVTKPTSASLRFWPHEFSLFFGGLPLFGDTGIPLGIQLYIIEDYVINGIGAWVIILVSVVITAFFIPNMLRKGTIDLLIVKPIHRWALLVYKYVGGLTFILLNTCVAVGGTWLVIGLRSGIWAPGFLWTIPVITFFFAILYAFSTLFAVVTRSSIAALLLTVFVWFVMWITGFLYGYVEGTRQQEERRHGPEAAAQSQGVFSKTVRVIHFVMPRAKDLDQLTSQLLVRDLLTANQVKAQKIDSTPISWGESLTVSGLYIAVALGLSCIWFARRDY
jgi:ABC-type transport system involved in multi-copper enzyme maturation permease subunit